MEAISKERYKMDKQIHTFLDSYFRNPNHSTEPEVLKFEWQKEGIIIVTTEQLFKVINTVLISHPTIRTEGFKQALEIQMNLENYIKSELGIKE